MHMQKGFYMFICSEYQLSKTNIKIYPILQSCVVNGELMFKELIFFVY